MANMVLRPYQIECIEKIKDSFYKKGKSKLLVSLPTGSGKTVIFGSLVNELHLTTLILTHTEELLFQTAQKMQYFNPDVEVGLLYAKEKNFGAKILVATIQSACTEKSLEKLAYHGYELIIADECHHSAANTWKRVINKLEPKLLVGFTATAFRSDNKGLGEIYEEVVYEKGIMPMINTGYLSPIISKQIRTDIDLSSNNDKYEGKQVIEDFLEEELEVKMNCSEYIDNTIDKFKEDAFDRKAIAFCTSVSHAKNMADAFSKKGFNSQYICGEMKTDLRQSILQDFKDDKIQILTNCQLLTEGFDEPSVNAIIIAKPTKSKNAFQQMIGRGLRLYPNKTNCLILDFTDIDRTVYSVARLVKDSSYSASDNFDQINIENRERQLLSDLPPKLNSELKTFLVNINLFPNDFKWNKDDNGTFLKGVKYDIYIVKKENGFHDVYYVVEMNITKTIEKNIDFEMAYGIAESYVRKDISNFILVNRNAPWRKSPISEKQENLLRKKKYKNDIDKLTKGQAADIIDKFIYQKEGKK